MEEPKIIKKFEPIDCPHCNKPLIIGSQSMTASIVSVNTIEDIKKAKQSVIGRLNEISFNNEKDKDQIIKWLNDDNTIIDNADVESLLRQIAIEQIGGKTL